MNRRLEAVARLFRSKLRPGDAANDGGICTAAIALEMIANPPSDHLVDQVCRQIDVRGSLAAEYRSGWTKDPNSGPATDDVASAIVIALLARSEDPDPTGRGLKSLNSALKLLDLYPDLDLTPFLRAEAACLIARTSARNAR